jgi:hypothetical protein
MGQASENSAAGWSQSRLSGEPDTSVEAAARGTRHAARGTRQRKLQVKENNRILS